MPGPWEKYAAATATPSGPWEKYGAPPPAAPEAEPEGFWHSLGSQVKGLLDTPAPNMPMDPNAAAGLVTNAWTALRQAHHPIDPKTGLPIVLTPEARTMHIVGAAYPPLEKAMEQLESGNLKGAAGTAIGGALPFAADKVGGALGKVGKVVPEAVRNYTPSGDIPSLIGRTVAGNTVGRLPGASLAELAGTNALTRPTLREWVQALRPDPQLSLFRNTPKLGNAPTGTLSEMANPLAVTNPALPQGEITGPSNLPRVPSGEAVLSQALTALDNKTLLKVARSRGIDVSAEANVKAGVANRKIINKIINDFSPDELDDVRSQGMEVAAHKPVFGPATPESGAEAWRYKVLKTYFPDVEMPKPMQERAQATIAQRPGAEPEYQPTRPTKLPSGARTLAGRGTLNELGSQASVEDLLQQSIKQAQAAKAPSAPPPGKPQFTLAPADKSAGQVLVKVDPAKLDAAVPKDDYYVGEGGKGAAPQSSAMPGRYTRFEQWLKDNPDTPIEAPRVGMDDEGNVGFTNGRHRFAVLRDQGVKEVQVSVEPEQAAAFKKQFGVKQASQAADVTSNPYEKAKRIASEAPGNVIPFLEDRMGLSYGQANVYANRMMSEGLVEDGHGRWIGPKKKGK